LRDFARGSDGSRLSDEVVALSDNPGVHVAELVFQPTA
jgi:hypothetical protein